MPRPLATNSGLPYRDRPTHVVATVMATAAVLVAGATVAGDGLPAGLDAVWLGIAIALSHVTIYLARLEPDSHLITCDEIPILAALVATPEDLGWSLVVAAAVVPFVRRYLAMLGRMRSASVTKLVINVAGLVLGGSAALHAARTVTASGADPVVAAAAGGVAYFVVTMLITATAMIAATDEQRPVRLLAGSAREALLPGVTVTIVGLLVGAAVRGTVAPAATILLVVIGLYGLARTRMRTWRVAEAGDRILRVVPQVLDGDADVDAAILETARRLLACREARISREPAGPRELGVPLQEDGSSVHLVVGDRIGEHRAFDIEDLVLLENLATLASSARAHRWTVDRLRRSEETRAAIVGALGHDLRSPLATVASSLATLRTVGHRLDPATSGELVDGAEHQTQRALAILDDLLALERLTTDPLTTAPGDVRAAARAVAASHPGVVTIDGGGQAFACLDHRVIERILDNLVSNAEKHAPGTPIRISWGGVGTDIAIVVEDGGEGITSELRERLMGPFQQGDPRVAGVGLGLHLARRFAELAGGRLEIGDAPGGGAAIRVVLPAAEPVAPSASHAIS